MTDHAHIRDLAQRVYADAGPLLGTHVRCRCSAMAILGVCAGLGIRAQLHFAQDDREAGGPHYWVVLPDGSRIDNLAGPIRLRPPPAQATPKHVFAVAPR